MEEKQMSGRTSLVSPDPIPNDIPQNILKYILRAGLSCPSFSGRRYLEFIVIQDKDLLQRMSGSRKDSDEVFSGAVCAIAVIADEFDSDTVIEDSSAALARMQIVALAGGCRSVWVLTRSRCAVTGETSETYLRKLLGLPPVKRTCGLLVLTPRLEMEGERSPNREDMAAFGRVRWGTYTGRPPRSRAESWPI